MRSKERERERERERVREREREREREGVSGCTVSRLIEDRKRVVQLKKKFDQSSPGSGGPR